MVHFSPRLNWYLLLIVIGTLCLSTAMQTPGLSRVCHWQGQVAVDNVPVTAGAWQSAKSVLFGDIYDAAQLSPFDTSQALCEVSVWPMGMLNAGRLPQRASLHSMGCRLDL